VTSWGKTACVKTQKWHILYNAIGCGGEREKINEKCLLRKGDLLNDACSRRERSPSTSLRRKNGSPWKLYREGDLVIPQTLNKKGEKEGEGLQSLDGRVQERREKAGGGECLTPATRLEKVLHVWQNSERSCRRKQHLNQAPSTAGWGEEEGGKVFPHQSPEENEKALS